GRIRERAERILDADGLCVAPGFIEGHCHFDAQLFWDPFATNSSYHGVTTAVMGNCGFTLAPCRPTDEGADLVIRSIERAEDIYRDDMAAGVPWKWGTFGDYLDAVDATPKSMNYAGYV